MRAVCIVIKKLRVDFNNFILNFQILIIIKIVSGLFI